MFLVTLAAGIMGVVSHRVVNAQRQSQQRTAVEQVLARGGDAQLIYSSLPIGAWLENGNAPNLLMLNSKNITDDDLAMFETAPTTRGLYLFNNQISDGGLVHLKDLKLLDFLDLRRNAGITDAGLVHLEGLTKLENLYLMGTSVTPAGVAKLQRKLPKTKIRH
jgi:hypothetical protein